MPPGRHEGGQILFKGQDLTTKTDDEIRAIRGNDIAMIFQEPMTALNPVYTVGNQIGETVMLHQGLDKEAARAHSIDMLLQQPTGREVERGGIDGQAVGHICRELGEVEAVEARLADLDVMHDQADGICSPA